MSKRLLELLRQRTLLQEHLAWLEREIAAESGGSATVAAPPPLPATGAPVQDLRPTTPTANTTSATTPPPLPQFPSDVEKLVAQYQKDPGTLTQDTRRGCLMLFWIALGSSLLLAGIVYWLYARHLGRWW